MTVDPDQIRTREDLRSFLSEVDEEAIILAVRQIGSAEIVRRVFDATEAEFDSAKGPRTEAVVQWDIEVAGEPRISWQTSASRQGLVATPGDELDPAVTLRMDVVTFLGLMAGVVRGIEALGSGALTLEGDLQLAMEIEGWFPH